MTVLTLQYGHPNPGVLVVGGWHKALSSSPQEPGSFSSFPGHRGCRVQPPGGRSGWNVLAR